MRARGVGRKFWGNLLCRSRIFFRDSFRWRYPRAKHSKRLPENQQNLLLESIHFRWMARHKSRILLIGAALGEHSIPAPGTPTQITGKSMPIIPLLVVLSEYPPLRDQPLAKSTLAKLETYKSKLDAGVRVEGTERREHESVSRFKDIKDAIYDRFQKKNDIPVHTGKIHKAWIYIKMYDEQPVRDDWGSLKIMFEDVPRMFLNRVEKNFKDPVVKKKLLDINAGNILYVPDDARKPVTLAFHVYKTSNTYGITFVPFSIPLSTDIRNYISQLRNKTYLFGKGKMSSYVGKMLFDAGVKKKTNDPEYKPGLNTGSINLLRKSYVSTAFAAESLSAIDRETLAFAMKHSPMTSPNYLREHGLKVAQEQKNELEKITDDN